MENGDRSVGAADPSLQYYQSSPQHSRVGAVEGNEAPDMPTATALRAHEESSDVVVEVHGNAVDGAASLVANTGHNTSQQAAGDREGRHVDHAGPTQEAVSLLESGSRTDEAVDYGSSSGDEGREECYAKEEIKNRLWIKSSKRHKEALEVWDEKCKEFTGRRRWITEHTISVMNQMYQLIGLYVVFEGVLLTVVAQSNLVHCNNWWTVFALSALGSVVIIASIVQTYRSIMQIEENQFYEGVSLKTLLRRIENLTRHGRNFKFHTHAPSTPSLHRARGPRRALLCTVYSVILVLLIFAALFLVAIVRILCHPGQCP